MCLTIKNDVNQQRCDKVLDERAASSQAKLNALSSMMMKPKVLPHNLGNCIKYSVSLKHD